MSGLVALPFSTAMPHQFPDAVDVERDERILVDDAFLTIDLEKRRCIVARNAECGLGQVVGAEGEELRSLGDDMGADRGARQFDHRAGEIIDGDAGFGHDAPAPPRRCAL